MNSAISVSGSLAKRLTVSLISAAAILTTLLYFVVRDSATEVAQQSQDNILLASVTSMLDTAVIRDGQIEMDIPYSALSMLATESDDRVFYALYQDAKLLTGYANMTLPEFEEASIPAYQSTTFNQVSVRQVTATRTLVAADQRTRITATVAQTQDSLAGTLQRISLKAAAYGAAFFSIAVTLSIWVSSSTIGPLKRLADSIARRGPQDLSPVSKPVPQEMVPLVSSFNHLMTRLERSFSQSEEFIAEAAHRVRTPLSTVRSYAETTLLRVDKEQNRQAVRSMIRAIDESSRAATQLLDHAMITFRANQLEIGAIDLNNLVEEIVQRLQPLAEMKDVDLRLHTDEQVSIKGDPILIQNAVRNIIDNALKYAPAESMVTIQVCATPTARVKVVDEGTGFPDEEIGLLTQRFARGSNSNGTIGSGLGLTIAKDVADAHAGQLIISNEERGGACVVLCL